ncbi:hypothetical protein MKL09_31140 [Methylobacterium sp. J-048]|uniref:hypothetical protein n=1 Tax=Methylobacterium sp. J-048 TaxID=2836635 RepID=UPI001FBAB254|nr:hypothetical protein [Methylobacterium sp. J-048]MCJ2060963.1 hypothetical protein [Methylobacterium sp. J-048]
MTVEARSACLLGVESRRSGVHAGAMKGRTLILSLGGAALSAASVWLAHAPVVARPVQAGTLPVAVYEDRDYDAKRFAASRVLGLKTFPAQPIFVGLEDFIRDRLVNDGVRVVSKSESEDRITLIEAKITRSTHPASPFMPQVNRSIDLMFCHNPIVSASDKSWQCQHLVFEFYLNEDYELGPLYEEIWRTVRETKPVALPGTSAFRPRRITILDVKLRT